MAADLIGRLQFQPAVLAMADPLGTSDDSDPIRPTAMAHVRTTMVESRSALAGLQPHRSALVRTINAELIPTVFPGDHP